MLPDGFADLEAFIADWAHGTEVERHAQRRASTMAELRGFYDTMVPRMPEVLNYLATRRLDALSAADERLMQLTLSLAEVAPAIELFGSPIIKDAVDSRRFSPVEGRTAP